MLQEELDAEQKTDSGKYINNFVFIPKSKKDRY